jgi:hypothetical protein
MSVCERGKKTVEARLETANQNDPFVDTRWYKSNTGERITVHFAVPTWRKRNGTWTIMNILGDQACFTCLRDEHGTWRLDDYWTQTIAFALSSQKCGYCRLLPADLLKDIQLYRVKQSIAPRLTDAYNVVDAFL